MYKGSFTILHTKIFTTAVYFKDVPLQLTVFSNVLQNVNFLSENYIIIPFPLSNGRNRVKLLDLDNYPKLFEDLSLSFKSEIEDQYDNLGKYEIKYETEFEPDVKKELDKLYGKKFGFIKCVPKFHKLKTEEKINAKTLFLPFGYINEIMEDTRLYIPTKIKFMRPPEIIQTSDIELDSSANDRYISIMFKRAEKPQITAPETDKRYFEIYVINFPRILKNTLLDQPGVTIKEKKVTSSNELFISKSKISKTFIIKDIKYLFQIIIDDEYKFNHNILL